MAGRPRQFEPEVALSKARDLFWEQGYEAASVRNLLDCMGINRGSMYDTFGDKRALFLKAFDQYGETVNRQIAAALNAPGSPRRNLETVLRRIVSNMLVRDPGSGCRGCLITNTAVELAPHDADIAAAVRTLLDRTTNAFEACLDRAVEAGEVRTDLNTRAVARHLSAVMQGLMVLGKAEIDEGYVQDVVDVALGGLN